MGLHEGMIIKKRRKQKGYTQKELCAKLGISTAPIHQVENGIEAISLANLKAICNELDLNLLITYK